MLNLPAGLYIYLIFHAILTIYAVYLSYQCNGKQINLLGFLIAIFFPYFYILYKAGSEGLCMRHPEYQTALLF